MTPQMFQSFFVFMQHLKDQGCKSGDIAVYAPYIPVMVCKSSAYPEGGYIEGGKLIPGPWYSGITSLSESADPGSIPGRPSTNLVISSRK